MLRFDCKSISVQAVETGVSVGLRKSISSVDRSAVLQSVRRVSGRAGLLIVVQAGRQLCIGEQGLSEDCVENYRLVQARRE